jgi:histone H1/5
MKNITNIKNNKYSAAMVFEADKARVQALRTEVQLGEKETMRLMFDLIDANKAEFLQRAVNLKAGAAEIDAVAAATAATAKAEKIAAKVAERAIAAAEKAAAKAKAAAEKAAEKAAAIPAAIVIEATPEAETAPEVESVEA